MIQAQSVVIGAWTLRALQRSRTDLFSALTDYKVARKVLTPYDLADWQYLMKNFKLQGRNFTTMDLEQLYRDTGLSSDEFKNAILPLSTQLETVTAVNFRLGAGARGDNTMDGYRFIHVGPLCLIVIPEGFEHLKDTQPAYEVGFIRSWVKALLEKIPVHQVSQFPIFRAYLEMFTI